LRRGYIDEHYSEIINALYGDQERVIIEGEIKYQDGRASKLSTSVSIIPLEEKE